MASNSLCRVKRELNEKVCGFSDLTLHNDRGLSSQLLQPSEQIRVLLPFRHFF